MTAQIAFFDRLPDGRDVEVITLKGPKLTAKILTLGATLQDLRLEGHAPSLVLGFDSIAPYVTAEGLYVGALVGRFANRLKDARFTLDGEVYQLAANEGRNQLHGGAEGIHLQLWEIADYSAEQLRLRLALPDGHMGYPGQLEIEAEISVAGDALSFILHASARKATPCSLAHHGYFQLDPGHLIDDYEVKIAADHYLPVDGANIPTGEIAGVAGSAFDLRHKEKLGPRAFDHNFCLSPARRELHEVARVEAPNGLRLTVHTTEPGLQLYDGRHFEVLGREGQHYGPRAALALETQFWPDSPNQPDFPDAILRPGQTWRAETRYVFTKA